MATSARDDKEVLLSSNVPYETLEDLRSEPIVVQPRRESNLAHETLDDSQPKPIVVQPQRQPVPLLNVEDWTDTLPISPDQFGLEYLIGLDHIFIYQKVHMISVLTSFVSNNDYTIKNDANGDTLLAVEETHWLVRNLLKEIRPFEIKVLDNNQREIFHLSRPMRCNDGCFPCFRQELAVTTPLGHVIAYVKQEWSIRMPKLQIQTASGDSILRVDGPWCPCSMCCHVEFVITSADGSTEFGRIIKRWSGLIRECCTHADHFEITFPVDLDVDMKAALVGACLLIDYMYFE